MNTNPETKNTRIVPVEVSVDDLAVWDATAKANGYSRSYWIRRLGNEAAGLPVPPQVKRGRRPKVKVEETPAPVATDTVDDVDIITDDVDEFVDTDTSLGDEVNILGDAEWEQSTITA